MRRERRIKINVQSFPNASHARGARRDRELLHGNVRIQVKREMALRMIRGVANIVVA